MLSNIEKPWLTLDEEPSIFIFGGLSSIGGSVFGRFWTIFSIYISHNCHIVSLGHCVEVFAFGVAPIIGYKGTAMALLHKTLGIV
jgi:hypothetical protein